MAKLLKLRRGTTTQHGSFTGAEGEVTIDTTKDTAVVHDGAQAGGRPLAREDMSNVSSSSIVGQITASALAGNKVQPNFGTQDIETTGNIDLSDSTGTGNNRIKLGTGDDLQIYHDGSNSYVADTGTGNLNLNGSLVQILNPSATEIQATFQENGAVKLYHDNSLKFQTNANGTRFIGSLSGVDNDTIKLGTGNDLQIFHNGTNSFISNTTGILQIDSDSTVQVNATEFKIKNAADTETIARFIKDGACELYHNNVKKFNTDSGGAQVFGILRFDDGSSNQINFGNSADLQIYHDGSNSYIYQDGTGELKVNTSTFRVMNKNGDETQIYATQNGKSILYYDNSNKLETTSTGIKVLGIPEFRQDSTVTDFTNLSAPGANNSGLYVQNVGGTTGNFAALSAIAHSGNSVGMSASFIAKSHATGYSPEVYITQRDGGNSQRTAIKITNPGAVELNHAGTKQVQTISTGLNWQDNKKAEFGNSGDLKLYHNGSASYIDNGTGVLWLRNQSSIYARSDEILLQTYTDSTNENYLVATRAGDVKLYYDHSEKFRTASTGVHVTADSDIRIEGGSWAGDYTSGIKIQPTANDSYFQFHGTLEFRQTNGNHAVMISQSGNITAAGNVTAYSDARLKTNVNTINDALSICGKLRGVSFDWKETGEHSIGVIAQEVEEVLPEVVLNNVNTDPATGKTTEVKSVDYGKIVGVLINAINELKAEVDELKGGK